LSLVSGIKLTSDFYFTLLDAQYTSVIRLTFLEIKLFTFDYHENKSRRTVD